MVTFAAATKNTPSFPTRAPAQRRVSHFVAITCSVPRDSCDSFKADCQTLARLVSPSRDPIGYEGSNVFNYFAYTGNQPAIYIDPSGLTAILKEPPGGWGLQQHHFFPRGKQPWIEQLCKDVGFSVDEFTILVQGNVKRYSEHWWFQYGCGNWNEQVQEILDKTPNCCDFMSRMVDLINNVNACVARNRKLISIPKIKTQPYKNRPAPNNWPGGNKLIELACKKVPKNCPKPFPVPMTVPAPKPLPIPYIPTEEEPPLKPLIGYPPILFPVLAPSLIPRLGPYIIPAF